MRNYGVFEDLLYYIDCDIIEQTEPNGTANAIYLAKDYIDSDFLALSGDIIYTEDQLRLLMSQKNSLLCTEMEDRLFEYGTLDLLRGNKIQYINEKSTLPTSKVINCGSYHFTPEVFDYIPKTEIDKRFKERIITNTINLMVKDGIEFVGLPTDYHNEITYKEDIKIIGNRLIDEEVVRELEDDNEETEEEDTDNWY